MGSGFGAKIQIENWFLWRHFKRFLSQSEDTTMSWSNTILS